jgi:hypothetical protein
MDQELSNPYLIMNSKGFVVEQSDTFNKNIYGQISDIVAKSKNILQKDTVNTIEIVFENKTILIKDNIASDLNITMVVNNEKI